MDHFSFLPPGGAAGRALRARDWAATPVGPPATWPEALRLWLANMLGASEAMCLAWGPGLTLFFNDGCAPLLGARTAGGMGMALPDLWPDAWPDAWPDVAPLMGRALAGEATRREDVPLTVTRHGRPEATWWTFACNPLFDGRGAVRGMWCAATETTARVPAERHAAAGRARLGAMLEGAEGVMAPPEGPRRRVVLAGPTLRRLVGAEDVGAGDVGEASPAVVVAGHDLSEAHAAERTARLRDAEDQLRQAQKMEAIGQLTGGVVHDFNNLLTPIMGGLDVLRRRGVGGPRERRLIENALQSAERARTLVGRLLAFARRQPLAAGPVDLAGLVEGLRDLVASAAGPQVRLVLEAEAGLPPATADRNGLEIAVLNLAVNARDAMPGGGTLTVAARLAARPPAGVPAPCLRLVVADTGTGMDAPTLVRATEPFFSTKGAGQGTGLGLSLVHDLVTQLGGALTLASAPGQGTEVALWLPVSPALVRPRAREDALP